MRLWTVTSCRSVCGWCAAVAGIQRWFPGYKQCYKHQLKGSSPTWKPQELEWVSKCMALKSMAEKSNGKASAHDSFHFDAACPEHLEWERHWVWEGLGEGEERHKRLTLPVTNVSLRRLNGDFGEISSCFLLGMVGDEKNLPWVNP